MPAVHVLQAELPETPVYWPMLHAAEPQLAPSQE